MTAVDLKRMKDIARAEIRHEFRKYPGDDLQVLSANMEKLIVRVIGAVAYAYDQEELRKAGARHDARSFVPNRA